MSDQKAAKISKFRDKHERQLLSIMAQSIACSACLAEGNAPLLRTEMDVLCGQILELVEQERRDGKRETTTTRKSAPVIAIKGAAT